MTCPHWKVHFIFIKVISYYYNFWDLHFSNVSWPTDNGKILYAFLSLFVSLSVAVSVCGRSVGDKMFKWNKICIIMWLFCKGTRPIVLVCYSSRGNKISTRDLALLIHKFKGPIDFVYYLSRRKRRKADWKGWNKISTCNKSRRFFQEERVRKTVEKNENWEKWSCIVRYFIIKWKILFTADGIRTRVLRCPMKTCCPRIHDDYIHCILLTHTK